MPRKPGYLLIGSLLASCSLFASQGALAGTLTWTGTGCGGICLGSNFGTLTLPATITFTDTFVSPTDPPVTDDWKFTIPAASAAMTGSGVQLGVQGVTPTITSFQLFSGATQIATGTSFSGGLLWVIGTQALSAGTYDLIIGAKGSYSGTLSAAAVPLPASAWLMVSGLIGFAVLARRRRDEVAPA